MTLRHWDMLASLFGGAYWRVGLPKLVWAERENTTNTRTRAPVSLYTALKREEPERHHPPEYQLISVYFKGINTSCFIQLFLINDKVVGLDFIG